VTIHSSIDPRKGIYERSGLEKTEEGQGWRGEKRLKHKTGGLSVGGVYLIGEVEEVIISGGGNTPM